MEHKLTAIALIDGANAMTLSSLQELTLRAAVDRIIPPDDTPGAVEAGVLDYFARKLGSTVAVATSFAAVSTRASAAIRPTLAVASSWPRSPRPTGMNGRSI